MINFDSQNPESNIFIDIGNSSIKIGFKVSNKWVVHTCKTPQSAAYKIKNHPHPVKHIVLSSVREQVKTALEREIEAHLIYELLVSQINAEQLEYVTPNTLGIDRYLGCLGAYSLTTKSVVVADAGTACALDFMDGSGVYKGGVIMPGLQAILGIFKQTAPELPEIDMNLPESFPGKSTLASLKWGQLVMFTDGVKSMLNRFTGQFGEYDLYITGGDASAVNKLLGEIGTVKPELVFVGMEQMMGYSTGSS